MGRSRGRPSCRPLATGALLAVLAVTTARAAEPAPDARPPAAAIASLRDALEARPADDATRKAALAELDEAAKLDRRTDEVLGELAALEADGGRRVEANGSSAGATEESDELAFKEWIARLPPGASAETLERVLDNQRSAVSGLDDQAQEIEAELATILARPAEANVEIAALRRRADALSGPTALVEPAPALVAAARRLRIASELRAIEAELALRRAEQETSLGRQRRREQALDVVRREQRRGQRRIEWLQQRIAALTREELEARVARLAAVEASIEDGASVAAKVAGENRELGLELLGESDRLAADRDALAALEPERDRIATALSDSRTRLELGGTSAEVGRWLWGERRGLEPVSRLEARLERLRSDLAALRLRLIIQRDEERALADVPAAARKLLEASQAESVDEGTVARAGAALEPLLAERVAVLKRLEPVLRRRVRTLELSEMALIEAIETTRALQQLLDRYLLWTPSHAPIDSSWLERVPEGLADLTKPARWATTIGLAWKKVGERPVLWVGIGLLWLATIELRRRAPARIRALEPVTRQILADHLGVTLQALVWTLVAALPIPAALAIVGGLLQAAGEPNRYSDSLGRTLVALVAPVFAVQTLRWTSIEGGLGHAHFRWTRARREALRHAVPRVAAIVLPLYFVTTLAFTRNLDLPNDVQARVAVAIASIALAVGFVWLFDVGRVWVLRGVESEPSLLRRSLRVVLPAGLIVVAGLALAGFVYSAVLLLHAWIASIVVVVAVTLGVGVLGRGLLIGERRLALHRLAEQQASAAQARGEGTAEAVQPEISLEQVNTQTQSVLRLLRVGLLATGLVWVWKEVLPAVTRLDEIVVWTFRDTGPDGLPAVQPVSLMAALFGLMALVLTILSSKNLPGLLELGLLSRTRIDAASRYAITNLLRYALVIVGTLIGLELLGLRWSQLQWMAAALTVGLGFGLQEIFANFVSGLILLFERPFRVGDVITAGDTTGRVTRIRTRATTILDFDNREIVVPNKTFITGQLLNWTLSDTTTRLTLKVGVAYGVDPDVVHRLLIQAATAHPLVLDEPAPRSWFLGFGANALDFELRVFVANLADRLPVQSELLEEIARLLAEQGIEHTSPPKAPV